MGPLASRLRKAACLFLVFCLLPWQEPARALAETPPPPAADAGADLVLEGLPPDVRKQVDAILGGPNRDAFLANARKAKLPEIRARLAALSGDKIDPRDPQAAASRAELTAWVKGATELKHDLAGAADGKTNMQTKLRDEAELAYLGVGARVDAGARNLERSDYLEIRAPEAGECRLLHA